MNKKTSLIFIMIILCASSTNAQKIFSGLPVIENYSPKNYYYHNQNWDIASDSLGRIYFGNSSGLMIYDGVNWFKETIPNKLVRRVSIVNDKIIVGGAEEFGYFIPSGNSGFKYTSLVDFLPDSIKQFGHIWDIVNVQDTIYFRTINYIFRFIFKKDRSRPELNIYYSGKDSFESIFKIQNHIYVKKLNDGLLKESGDQIVPTDEWGEYGKQYFFFVLKFMDTAKEKYLIGFYNKGFFIYEDGRFRKMNTDIDDIIFGSGILLNAASLPDGKFAVGTLNNGIKIIDRYGNLVYDLNSETGLLNSTIYSLRQVKNNLWAATNYGISKISIPSPVAVIDKRMGLKGPARSSIKLNNNLFFLTATEIYRASDKNTLIKINKYSLEWWDLAIWNGELFAASGNGLARYLNNDFHLGASGNIKMCYTLLPSKLNNNIMYAGMQSGLGFYKYNSGNIIETDFSEYIQADIRKIIEDKKGNLWLGRETDGFIHVIFKNNNYNLKDSEVKYYNLPEWKESEIFVPVNVNGTPIFLTNKNIYYFEESVGIFRSLIDFKSFPEFRGLFFKNAISDSDGNIWISAIKDNHLILIKGAPRFNKSYRWRFINELSSAFDFTSESEVSSMFYDDYSKEVWICTTEGIIKFDEKEERGTDAEFYTILSEISVNSDSIIFSNHNLSPESKLMPARELSSNINSIRFKFSAVYFDKSSLNKYSSYLEGFDKKWTNWSYSTQKNYTNLPSGNYKFFVKARNIYGKESETAEWDFEILTPFYKQIWAIILYFLFGFLLFYLIIKYRFSQLEKRNIQLGKIVEERTKKLSEQTEKLIYLDDLKSKFFANISHEFRTPLTIILGQIYSVIEKINDGEIRDKLKMAAKNGAKLEKLIEQLLEISRLESGKMKLKVSYGDIIGFVKTVTSNFESLAHQKRIDIRFAAFKDSFFIYFDYTKVEKIFNNLIFNAIKFTEDHGTILVSVEGADESYINIIIKDSGIGIPEKELPYIFDRFYQTNTSKQFEGIGLGLSLVKEFIDMHKGKISVESAANRGTKFTLSFPVDNIYLPEEIIDRPFENPDVFSPVGDDDENSDYDAETENFRINKPLVLIVEDNKDLRGILKEQLNSKFSILEASNGEKGFETAVREIPELIISDVMMPKMDGIQMVRKLKNEIKTSHIPVLILTAKASLAAKIEGFESGVDHYLVKPFNKDELLARAASLIEQRVQLREKYKNASFIDFDEIKAKPLDQKFIDETLKFIKSNLGNNQLSMSMLAEHMNMSGSQLNRKLKSLIDQTSGQLIRNIRLDFARELILKKAFTLTEISEKVGFGDLNSFGKSFKSKFGITPSEYIK